MVVTAAVFLIINLQPEVQAQSNRATDAPPGNGPAKPSRPAVQYRVPGTIVKLQQQDSMACWATAATILLRWKLATALGADSELTVEKTVQLADANRGERGASDQSFMALSEKRSGLPDKDKPAFLKSLGFVAEGPANYTVGGWLDLLQRYGLLWVTTQVSVKGLAVVHAQIVTALEGDGTYDGTVITFIDPADGEEHHESLLTFVKRYEAVAVEDMQISDADLRLQVIHFARQK